MNRFDSTFARLKASKKKALVAYLTASDPDFERSLEACRAALKGGAEILEIGVPFSDPIGDGPTVQRAMQRALAAGGGLGSALKLVEKVRQDSEVPIVLFGYLNPLLWHGFAETCARAAQAGVDGLLVVDAPPREARPLQAEARAQGLDWITMVSPTTPTSRLDEIGQLSSGFVYLVSMLGVTGGALDTREGERMTALSGQIAAMRQHIHQPICVGFGIRDQHSARCAALAADGVVAGSVIIEALDRGVAEGRLAAAIEECVRELGAGLGEIE